ncbi:MAG TPA: ribosome maturation factor RimM [Anaerolineae bacterium]|nr:ribosome maturation factor RimM [Anaerolineae bacterium]
MTKDQEMPRYLLIGRILRPHGVRGEMRVEPHTDDMGRFKSLEHVYIGAEDDEESLVKATVVKSRPHKNVVLVQLAEYPDRDAAESLRNMWLHVPYDEAIPLEEGEYYLYQLLGLTVKTETGEVLGTISDVIETKANNVFVVKAGKKEYLLPDTDEVVQAVNVADQEMIVHLLPGLI